MELIYVIPISFFALLLSFFLFRRAAGSLNILEPNMISYIFYYNIILQIFISSVLVILKADGNHYVISQVSDDARLYGWLSVIYMMIFMPVGMLLSKRVFSKRTSIRTRLLNYSASEINIKFIGHKSLKYSIWFFTIVSIIACLYVFYIIGYFPFFKIFDVSAIVASELRIISGREFSGNIYIKNFFALLMMPIISYMWIFYYFRTKNVLDLIVFLLCFILSLSILYYDFSKSPMLSYILSFVFVYFYGKGRVNKTMAIVGFAIVILLIFILYSFMGLSTNDFFSYNSGPIGRVLLGQSSGLYMMFNIFPDDYTFIGLASMSELLSNIFNIEYVDRAGRTAMIAFNPRAVEAGTAGVMNSIYIAEAWANFGVLGVLLAPIWVGFIIQTLYIYFLKSPKSPLHLAFFTGFSVGGAITGGFNEYIYNPAVLLYLFFAMSVYFLAKIFKSV